MVGALVCLTACQSGGGATPDGTPPGGPGCGFQAAAFCETFDSHTSSQGRAGELDPTRWSGGRIQPQLPTYQSAAFAIAPAPIATCHAGLPDLIAPDRDTLICDPNGSIASKHLLMAVGAQNYGQNSYRIRQPFDFAGRTGTIVFDAEGFNQQLLGWISVEVTEDPIAVPSYDEVTNDEGGLLSKNGFELQFSYPCPASPPTSFSLTALHVFRNYADTIVPADWRSTTPAPCVAFSKGGLNHFEVHVSEQKIEVTVTPVSADGLQFGAPTIQLSQAVAMPLSRGYVHISAHNHATKKYAKQACNSDADCKATNANLTCANLPDHGACSCTTDADCKGFGANYICETEDTGPKLCTMANWLARWDNVGFDGPVIEGTREYEVPDALVGATAVNIGYQVPDVSQGPKDTLHLKDVDLNGVKSARIALSMWTNDGAFDQYVLKYRLNGGAWHDRRLTADEIVARTKPVLVGMNPGGTQGVLGLMLDVPLSDLRAGDNTLEFVNEMVPQSWPMAIANIDLVLDTK